MSIILTFILNSRQTVTYWGAYSNKKERKKYTKNCSYIFYNYKG